MANSEERTVAFGGAATTSHSRPLLLGHRGVRRKLRRVPPDSRISRPGLYRIPAENTLAAFDYALDHGCDGFEFDLRFTRDQHCVICHDPKYLRKEVAGTDYPALCRPGHDLTCLEDVLARFSRAAYLDVELKVAGNEEAVLAALREYPPHCGYVVSSFLPEVLRRLRWLDPALALGYICDHPSDAWLWAELPIQVFLPHRSLVSQRLVDEVHKRDVQVFTWTVNHRSEMLRFAGWGVDGLISDDPVLLAATFPGSPFPAKSEERTAKSDSRNSPQRTPSSD